MRTSVKHLHLILPALLPLMTAAQSLEEMTKTYPSEQAIFLDHSQQYRISLVNDLPDVQSEETTQMMFLSAESAALYGKGSFYHGSFKEIKQYSAYTRTAEGKKIKVADFKTAHSQSDGIFYDDIKETSFNYPGVAPGAVGTMEISSTEKDPHMLTPFYFSRGIPVHHSALKLSFPASISIKYVIKGINADKVKLTEDRRRGETTWTFEVNGLPAERPYDDAPGIGWYSTHIIFYIEKYTDRSGRNVSYLASPADLFRLYNGYIKGINTTVGTELAHIADSLCKNAGSKEEKARKIYGWVQQNIRYIAFEQGMEGFIPRDANLVCSRRFGDCKDMASILTTMLRHVGLNAWYTWIGTRRLPYVYTETPLPLVDNHMISTVKLDDRYIFLDATDPGCVFGAPSIGIQDKQAMLAIDDTSYKLLQVPVPAAEHNQVIDTTWLELTEQGLKGKMVTHLTGYYSNSFQDMFSYLEERKQEESIKSMFRRGSNKFQLDSFDVGDLSDKAHVRLAGHFTLRDYAKHIGNEWYLNMNLFRLYEHEEIDYPKRKMPIAFRFHDRKKYVVVLRIPKNYHVSYMPAGKKFHNTVWGFDLAYEQKDDQLIFTQEFDNRHLMLEPAQFQDWNKVLEQLFPLYKESISLTHS